jgi:alkyl hydroperoxide reductase subunit D
MSTPTITTDTLAERLDALFQPYPTAIGRDLKLNLRKLLLEGALAPEAAAPVLLALAETTGDRAIGETAEAWMQALGFPEDQVREAREGAAMMAMLNTYYSFRGKVADEAAYGPAGLRMTALARPALGKERFEMLAFAVSVVNGCATCIAAHEKVLREAGVTVEQLHDLARLGAVVKAASRLP